MVLPESDAEEHGTVPHRCQESCCKSETLLCAVGWHSNNAVSRSGGMYLLSQQEWEH